MSKMLIVTPSLPFPMNNGGILRSWKFIRALSQKYELSLLYPDKGSNSDLEGFQVYRSIFQHVWGIQVPKFRERRPLSLRKRVTNVIQGIPWEVNYSGAFEEKFLKILGKYSFDIILIRHIFNAHYIFRNLTKINARVYIDLDDIYTVYAYRTMQQRGYRNLYDKFRQRLNLYFLDKYLNNIREVEGLSVCSEADLAYCRKKKWSKKISLIPNSVDVTSYTEVSELTQDVHQKRQVLFLGTLAYPPNEDAVLWFVRDIWPLILAQDPTVEFHCVGASPKPDLAKKLQGKNIFLHPDVPSVIPYYQQSTLFIVPIRIAAGTRVKILEALSCKRPVVSTQMGAEGLNLKEGEHYLRGDNPRTFAEQCLMLLHDYQHSHQLAHRGYTFVKTHYDVHVTNRMIVQAFQ